MSNPLIKEFKLYNRINRTNFSVKEKTMMKKWCVFAILIVVAFLCVIVSAQKNGDDDFWDTVNVITAEQPIHAEEDDQLDDEEPKVVPPKSTTTTTTQQKQVKPKTGDEDFEGMCSFANELLLTHCVNRI
jgi:hypothetical protein